MTRTDAEVIIVGAGAAGLAAARRLSEAGLRVLIIEARDRLGGRIHTVRKSGIPLPIELGAEFIHGTPSETWDIIRSARLATYDVADSHWFLEGGRLRQMDQFWDDMEEVLGRLNRLGGQDVSFSQFLDRCCPDIAERVRPMALAYVEGFDAADPARVSARSLADEQQASQQIEEDRLFRLMDGYDQIINSLAAKLDPQRVAVRLNTVVSDIRWSDGSVCVAAAAASFQADRALLTLPLGVWKAPQGQSGAVWFDPDLPAKRQALGGLEMGAVVKIALGFRESFWEKERFSTIGPDDSLRDAAFFHARGPLVFTWWTWLPVRAAVLVGWSGGPAAARLSHRPHGQIRHDALESLSEIFGLSAAELESRLESAQVYDWQADPFSRGAYSYTLVGGQKARAMLAAPVEDTLFFAGEATHEGQSGTVAGALSSGYRAAEEVLASHPHRSAQK